MRDGAVVALEEVLAGDLPVRIDVVLAAEVELERVDVDDLPDACGDVAERIRERRGARFRIDEQEWSPRVDGDLLQAELVELEAGLAVGPRGGAQGAVEAVGPRVIRALKRLALSGAVRDDMAAMTAHVQEGTGYAVARACNHNGNLSGDGGEERAGLGELARVTNVLPGAREDPLPLAAQHL